MEEENENGDGNTLQEEMRGGVFPNIHILVALRGKVIGKEYLKHIKCFSFRLQTDKEFIVNANGDNVSTNYMIFQFIITKKLHRKFRRIIYNDNYIEVYGRVRQHEFLLGHDAARDWYIIETHSACECPKEVPRIPEFPQSPQIGNDAIPGLPQLTS
jgi:hypothetical protein